MILSDVEQGFVEEEKPVLPVATRWWSSYAVGALSALAAVVLRFALDPILGDHLPFATFFPAVAVAVFFGRLPGGLVAILLTTAAADYCFLSPRYAFGIQGALQAIEMVVFMVGGWLIVLFGETIHRAHDRAERLRWETERQLARAVEERTARLHEIVHDLELFSYSMAHDLRAPLRAIQGLAKVVLEDYSSCLPEEGQAHLNRLAAAANRMDQLILDVLHYSRLVQGELPFEKVDLQQLIEATVATFPNLHAAREHIRIEAPIPPVLANPGALTQVVSNLLSNAIKFVAPGHSPSVRIWAEPDGAYVRLNVEDNGIGIPLKAQHKIFGLFQRLHSADAYDGTGIGLAIVKKAAERMGGQVGLESQPGKGSRFWVALKRPPADEEAPVTTATNGQG